MTELKKILIGSPIHQKSEILNEFLISLKELKTDIFDISYYFIDDNIDEESKNLLKEFKNSQNNVILVDSNFSDQYIKTDHTHLWTESLINKVANFKNSIIKYAIENEFDYLFFIDSDLILNPETLNQLVKDKKEIVSNLFWTKWEPDTMEMPQVWLSDAYDMHYKDVHVDHMQQTMEFINKMRVPGVYKVGGLGACTLMSRKALLTGINFDRLYNLSFWGEDRHFCIRAVALGLELFVDTNYPAYHIYRDEDLLGVENFKNFIEARNKSIVESRVIKAISEVTTKFGGYSYKDYVSDENDENILNKYKGLEEYFENSDIEQKILNQFIDKDYIQENKIINSTYFIKYETDYDLNDPEIVFNIELSFSGYKNFESYYKNHNAVFVLKKTLDNSYLIREYEILDEVDLDYYPMIRYFKEKPTLTLSMIVKNEEHRYLRDVLESAKQYIDSAVIIDDGSTDNTVQICQEVLNGIPYKIIENKESKFKNEIELRTQQWNETIATDPDWILFLDADEIFEDRFKYEVKNLMDNPDIDSYMFRLYDFWDDEHYRDDELWCAHKYYRIFMMRYQKNFDYKFNETAQHCGRLPSNAGDLRYELCNIRLKHYGWANKEDRIKKYNRYMLLDPNGEFGSLTQYQSILDENMNLTKWIE